MKNKENKLIYGVIIIIAIVVATYISVKMHSNVEIAEVMWVDVDKVMDLLSYDDTKEIFAQVLNDLGNLTI